MNNDIEQRLREYGATIDAATATDLAERDQDIVEVSAHAASRRPRRTTAGLALLALVGVVVLGVFFLGRGDSKVRVAGSATDPATDSTPKPLCSSGGGDSAACPEEGPPLSAAQKAQFAKWRSEYNPADVARLAKQTATDLLDDASVVETMEGAIGCAVTRSAWAAANQAAPDQRAAAVNDIMEPELARLTERNWPPQSEMASIFQRLAEQLKTGDLADFDAPDSLFRGACGHAFPVFVGGRQGETEVADQHGNPVGYAKTSLIEPADARTSSPTTLIPVTDDSDHLVGYVAFDYGFVPLVEAEAPGFDIVKARVARYGCMDRIGTHDPSEYGARDCKSAATP